MKHTITINEENTTEHILHLDQHLPLTIHKLPSYQAYSIRDTPIYTTTTMTLNHNTINEIRQKNKHITRQTHMIIIQNTTKTPTTKIETIQENPLITTHTTTLEELAQTLKTLLEQLTPATDKPVTTREYTIYHDKTRIKTYTNKKYLQQIRETLNQDTTLTLQEAEYRAQQKYYQYISYDKHNQQYKLTIPGQPTTTHKKLKHALQEKNTITHDKEKDEETLCQNNTTLIEPLPPKPWNNKIHNIPIIHKKYQTKQETKHNNPDTVHITNQRQTRQIIILNTIKPDRNINRKSETTYRIQKTRSNKNTTYYTTKNRQQARYIRDQLEQNQYNTTQIPVYEQQYKTIKEEYNKQYENKYQVIDYYKNTTTKLTQKHDRKNQYQEHRLQQHNRTTKHQNNRAHNKQKFSAPSKSWKQINSKQ